MTRLLLPLAVLAALLTATPAQASSWQDCPRSSYGKSVRVAFDHSFEYDNGRRACRYIRSVKSWRTLWLWKSQAGFVTRWAR
jgi:hypothetical protein